MPRPSKPSLAALVPDVDPAYVFPVGTLKSLLIGLELNYNTYLVGHTGVGKTTLIEQVCARTNRPLLRMQHSSATEESHIVGQWTARATAGASETIFQLGPLPMAMQEGLVYLMDEVDFALPSVMAVYQAVLEHRPLVIPEAPPELRVIRPHPDFRIVGTGNSNGSGDGTGLYQGVRIQNLATFSRWTICEQVDYMPADVEGRALAKQAGISLQTAATFIAFAETIRKAHAAGKIGAPIGLRELVAAASIGVIRGGDFRSALRSSFSNRLAAVDKLAAEQMAARYFGP